MKPSIQREQRLYDALKKIACYVEPGNLRRIRLNATKLYGLSEEEAIEMIHENVLQEAKNATKGMRRPQTDIGG